MRHGTERQPSGLQKRWSDASERELRDDFSAGLSTTTQKARFASVSGPHASAWLRCVPDAEHMTWLSPREFILLARLRLGAQLFPTESFCGRCALARSGRRSVCDTHGAHALSCMCGGNRTTAHTAVLRSLCAIGSEAILQVSPEVRLFSSRPNARIDACVDWGATCDLVDVALTNALKPSSVAAAAATPGGAASQYEATKHATYGPLLADLQPGRHRVVPVVMDLFGAWGKTALTFITRLARRWGRHHDVGGSHAVSMVFQRLQLPAMQHIARHIAGCYEHRLPRDSESADTPAETLSAANVDEATHSDDDAADGASVIG